MLAMVQSVSKDSALASSPDGPETTEIKIILGVGRAHVPAHGFRYVLLALGVYAIFVYLHVPLVSIGLGLCALGAATIAAMCGKS